MSLSIITPTIGRPTLIDTFDSMRLWRDDEWIVVADGPTLALVNFQQTPFCTPQYKFFVTPATHNYGHVQRTYGMRQATGTHLVFMDDDDVYTVGARTMIQNEINQHPDQPILCKIRDRHNNRIWHEPVIRLGNVSTQMLIVPNIPARLGVWGDGSTNRGGDFHFIDTLKWPKEAFVWSTCVIATLRPKGEWNEREFFYGR